MSQIFHISLSKYEETSFPSFHQAYNLGNFLIPSTLVRKLYDSLAHAVEVIIIRKTRLFHDYEEMIFSWLLFGRHLQHER